MVDCSDKKNGGLACCTGYSIDLLANIAEKLDFDFVIHEVADMKWGAPKKSADVSSFWFSYFIQGLFENFIEESIFYVIVLHMKTNAFV